MGNNILNGERINYYGTRIVLIAGFLASVSGKSRV